MKKKVKKEKNYKIKLLNNLELLEEWIKDIRAYIK